MLHTYEEVEGRLKRIPTVGIYASYKSVKALHQPKGIINKITTDLIKNTMLTCISTPSVAITTGCILV